jgi:hypothetical protein
MNDVNVNVIVNVIDAKRHMTTAAQNFIRTCGAVVTPHYSTRTDSNIKVNEEEIRTTLFPNAVLSRWYSFNPRLHV